MSEYITGTTYGGTVWTPAYVTDLNQRTCIGCGRCFKVCPRDVFDLIEKDEALNPEDFGDSYGDFEDDDDNTMVMSQDETERFQRLTLAHAVALQLLQAGDFTKVLGS